MTNDIGFKEVDSTILNSAANVTRLQSLFRTTEAGVTGSPTEYDITLCALTAGDGSTPGSGKFYRLDPSTGTWVQITYAAHVAYTGATEATANTDGDILNRAMPMTAAFPAGSPSHDPTASHSTYTGLTTLGLPVLVICNGVDPTYVFPATPNVGSTSVERNSYTELHAGTLEPFIANTCTSWEGRMYYGDTQESNTSINPQRIRWSALFDASPDKSIPGSGFFDVRELQGRVRRLEPLDPFLVAYYSDGIVFIERTGLRIAPHRFRVVSNTRGILSPHSVCQISPREHFIIATDGFYILNANGQFREVGTLVEENIVHHKWHNTFFNNLDLDNSHRIQCHYDQTIGAVRIVWPNNTGSRTIWTYDIRSDRMFPDSWHSFAPNVTCFTDHTAQLRIQTTWADVTGTWAVPGTPTGHTVSYDASTPWSAGAPLFGRSFMHHGDTNGRVMVHDPTLKTFDNSNPTWSFITKRQTLGDPRNVVSFEQLALEFIDVGGLNNINATLNAFGLHGDIKGKFIFNASNIKQSVNQDGIPTFYPYLSIVNGRSSGGYFTVQANGQGIFALQRVSVDYRPTTSRIRSL